MLRCFSYSLFFLILAGCQLVPKSSYIEKDYCTSGSVSLHPASTEAQEALEIALSSDNGTGITAAVVIDGELVFAGSVGEAEKGFSLGPNSPMRTGSVAKLFTAVAAARLAEMNLLGLNEAIGTLVPETPDATITPYHLATHTSGIRHYNFNKMSEANNRNRFTSLTDALALFNADPLLSIPGVQFHYSSFGFNLLGVVIERSYGSPFEEALSDLVATPLGLSSLAIDDVETEIPCRPSFNTIAFGNSRINAPRRDNSDLYPSGGLLVSAPDLAVFADAVFNGDYLQPETVDLLKDDVTTSDGLRTGYGFGWQVGRSGDGSVEWYGHGGQINGAYASVRYYPSSRTAIAGMTNYNYWLTSKRPEFFSTIRVEFPELFL